MSVANHLVTLSRRYPAAWKQVEKFLLERDSLPPWPDYVFLPMAAWYAIVSEPYGGFVPAHLGPDIGRMAAVGTWRYTQGIYRFDRDVFDAIAGTELSGDLPTESLRMLPEWCVYIETPWSNMRGFFAHLEHDVNNGREELRLCLDIDGELLPVPIHLGKWTLAEAVTRALAETSAQAKRLGERILFDASLGDQGAVWLQSLVSLVLYLCTDEPDIAGHVLGDKPHNPAMKKTKKGMRLFAPDKPRVFSVGTEIGDKIRRARSASGGTHSVSPHIRRAHWHGYWRGKGRTEYFLRWLPPIAVAVEDGDGDSKKED